MDGVPLARFSNGAAESYGVLSESRWRPIVLGAIAPANYLAGAKFGAVTLPLGDVTTMLILVPLWMVMLPLMVKFSQRELAAA